MSLIHSHKTGSHEIIAITDGGTEFGTELFPGTSAEHIQSLLDKAAVTAIETNFNAFLVRSPGRNLLVDAGPRDLFGPGCGKLPDGLKEARHAYALAPGSHRRHGNLRWKTGF